MKRFLSLVLALAMTLSLAACGGSKSDTSDSKAPEQNTDSSSTGASESGIDASALYAIGGGATGGTFNAMGSTFTQFFNDGKVYGSPPPPPLAACRTSCSCRTAPAISALSV